MSNNSFFYNFQFKYIIIGDSSTIFYVDVGKSCLLYQFTEHKFRSELDSTIGGNHKYLSGIRNKSDQYSRFQCETFHLGHGIELNFRRVRNLSALSPDPTIEDLFVR
jgi:hypothetical protein